MSIEKTQIIGTCGSCKGWISDKSYRRKFELLSYTLQNNRGLKFYERLEIKQVISYIRLITNQDDSLAFERIVNTPRRGIGNTALQYMHQISQESGCSLHKAAEIAIQDSIVKGKAKEALKLFYLK